MKNKLIIIGIIISIILSCTIASYAAITNVMPIVSANEVKAGENFTVTLKANCDDGINGISSSFTYDEDKLELVSATPGTNFANLGSGNEIAIISTSSTSINEADVFILTFKVKEGVAAGSEAKINFAETTLDSDVFENSANIIAPFEAVITVKAEPPVEQECEHGSYTTVDNQDGTHSRKCTKCEESLKTEDHTYQDGECVCGAIEPAAQECEHTWGEYTDNQDGTHSVICTKCGQEDKKTHTFDEEGICESCKALEDNDENKDEEEEKNPDEDDKQDEDIKEEEKNEEDETTVDKEIPAAGLNTMLAFGFVAIIVSIIMYRKNKKYEDIK